MDEKDGAFFADDLNKLTLNSLVDDFGSLSTSERSPFDSPVDFKNDDFDLSENYDTTDSKHANILSVVGSLVFGNKKQPVTKIPKHLHPKFIPKVLTKTIDEQEYWMNHKHRGKCVIINNTFFDSDQLPDRQGTQVDREELSKCFKRLDFDVQNWDEMGALDIRYNIDKLAREDFTDHDCLVICVLTHGDTNTLHAKDDKYYVEYLFESFKSDVCRTLAGKPKIFIIQACRGDRLDNGSIINFDVEDSNSSNVRIPQWADFLMAYSTIPGFYSWRNVSNGSWFIQAFTAALNENYKQLDLLSILTITNQKVAYDFESNTPSMPDFHKRKQIPMIASMLTRKVYFNKPKSKLIKLASNSKLANQATSTLSENSSNSSSSSTIAQQPQKPSQNQLTKEYYQKVLLNEKFINAQHSNTN